MLKPSAWNDRANCFERCDPKSTAILEASGEGPLRAPTDMHDTRAVDPDFDGDGHGQHLELSAVRRGAMRYHAGSMAYFTWIGDL